MGLYDSIYLKKKCPYCKEVSEMEFQTKDGDYGMDVYRVGDIFQNGQFRKIDAIGDCRSLTCQFEAAKEHVWIMGYYGGFSRSFDVYIYCNSKGKITNKMKIYQLNHHKGIMKGKLGELKGKEDNMQVIKSAKFKNGKWNDAKMKKMTTDGWLDKFDEDSWSGDNQTYQNILYLFNLEDSEEAMRLWFIFRYKLERIFDYLEKKLRIKEDDFVSVFLSNKPEDIYGFLEEGND